MTVTIQSNIATAPLGKVARFLRGITFKPEDVVESGTGGSVVCMRTKNVQADLDQEDLIAIPPEFVRRKELFLQESDILVSTANSWNLVGKCCWVPHLDYDATAGGFISILRADPGKVLPRYLYFWFNSHATQHSVRLCGRQTTNISNMSYERCEAIRIPLPPLPEQKRIADILDKADAIRRKRQEAVFESQQLLPSLFAKMFGEGGCNYEPEPLGDHLEFLTSGSRGWAKHYVPSGKRFIRSLDVQMNRIGSDHVAFVDPPNGTEAERTRVRGGDVLITITGSCIGRVAFIPGSFGEAYVSQHVAIARLKPTLRPRYCSMFLSLPNGGQRLIAKAQYGQTKPGLSLTNIRDFQVPIPPLAEQDEFLDAWDHFDRTAANLFRSVSECDGLFNALVQRAFKGEL